MCFVSGAPRTSTSGNENIAAPRDGPPLTPEVNGTAMIEPTSAVPVSSGVNAVLTSSKETKESGNANAGVVVTDVSMFFNTGPSSLNNVNSSQSINAGLVFLEKFK